ncbi:LuxR C-terminal-related transcriptional regulator [Cryptosporangium sp. NPDC051539]|uniref:LuxR C-terminal-related transcriptional regulator n=1 Tax=Cryptosporangium sp. NPDC051539 TaxID=3363962 RepID=UPI0037AC22C4
MCVANLDRTSKVVDVNLELVRQFGRASWEICGQQFCDLLHPSYRDKIFEQFNRLATGQRVRFDETMIVLRPDDTTFTGELTGITVTGSAGVIEKIVVLLSPDQSIGGEQQLARRQQLFTPMETRVLEGVAAGVSTVQLASTLFLSRGGVEYHVAMLLRKLKVNNRPALVSKAYSMGIFRLGSWPPRVLSDFSV